MARRFQTTIKLQLPAGKATPAPPVGTALGPHGLNIMDFCKQFNAKTAKEPDGMIFPVLVTVYTDRTFTFILKTPPASVLLKRAANIAKGSAEPNRNKVGKVTKKQVEEIAKIKLVDLNTTNLESAVRTVMDGAQHGPGSRGSLEVQALRGRRGRANDEEVRQERGEGRATGRSAPYKLGEAAELLKKTHHTKFNETVELAIIWALIQSIPTRSSAAPWDWPNGLGKTVRVLVIAGVKSPRGAGSRGGFRRRRRNSAKNHGRVDGLRRRDRHAGHDASAGKLGKVLGRAA